MPWSAAERVPSLLPHALVNSTAVLASFHLGLLLDRSALARVRAWAGLAGHPARFWALDALAHGLPPILAALAIAATAASRMAAMPADGGRGRRNPGLWTLALHATWCALHAGGRLDLSRVYVPMAPWAWRVMWATAVAAHVGTWSVARSLLLPKPLKAITQSEMRLV